MESPRLSDASTPVESSSPICADTPTTQPSELFDDDLDQLLRHFPVEDQYILVTGGLGFIGSHTTLELLKANYNVIVIDDLSNSFQDVLDRISLLASKFHEEKGTRMPSLHLHAHDYRDTAALRTLLEQYKLPSRWGTPNSKSGEILYKLVRVLTSYLMNYSESIHCYL